jgi:hypothetical protein
VCIIAPALNRTGTGHEKGIIERIPGNILMAWARSSHEKKDENPGLRSSAVKKNSIVFFLVFILVMDPLTVKEERDDCVEMYGVRVYL